jgi:uncharacterized DUF497 family protein
VVYEWEAKKAKANLRKHGASFEDASTIFLDPLALTFLDPDHSDAEEREVTIGLTSGGQVLFVSHCARGANIRIISARKATKRERRQYEEGSDEET